MAINSIIGTNIKISSTYQGHPLNFIAENKKINWDEHPVWISDSELKTLNIARVLAILRGNDIEPSSVAGIPPYQIVCETIHFINQLYKASVADYALRLDHACEEDNRQLNVLSTEYRWLPIEFGVGGAGAGGILGVALGTLSPSRKLKVYSTVASTLIGACSGLYEGRALARLKIEREGCVHRIKWLQIIDTLEEIRLRQTSEHIHHACIPLLEDLLRLEQQNQTDKHKVGQLRQLLLVHQAFFPEPPLEINLDAGTPDRKINIKKYLEALMGKFPALKDQR